MQPYAPNKDGHTSEQEFPRPFSPELLEDRSDFVVRGTQPWLPKHRELVLASAKKMLRDDGGPLRIGTLEIDLWSIMHENRLLPNLEGSQILIAPGYGNFPALCALRNAGLVVAIDKDPATIAWQQAILWFQSTDKFRQPYRIIEPGKHGQCPQRDAVEDMKDLSLLCEFGEPHKKPLCDNLAFLQADLTAAVPAVPGGYDEIVVPYLVNMVRGIEDDAPEFYPMLDNLESVLATNGKIHIFPAYAQGSTNGILAATHDCIPQLEAWAEKKHFSVEQGEIIKLYNAFNCGGEGSSATLRRR